MRIEVKAVAEDGTFSGLLSPYGNVDQGGDMVMPGAFTKSLQESGGRVPMLWQHDQACPIGELVLQDQKDGLHCAGRLLLEIPEAKKAYALLKAGVIKGLSIGYDPLKATVVNGVRQLSEIKLWEGSVVTFPMNLQALVSSVKSMERKGEFNDTLADMQLSNARYLMVSALDSSLSPLVWSGAAREDILAAAEAVIDEFKAAYMQFVPEYLDYLAREYGLDTKSWRTQREAKQGSEHSASFVLAELRSVTAQLEKALPAPTQTRPSEDAEAAAAVDSMRSLLRG